MKRFGFALALSSAAFATACATTGSDGEGAISAALAGNERLRSGRTLFRSRCQRCHALPKPTAVPPERWPAQVTSMASKASLSAEQTTLVTEYLMAASGGASPLAAAPPVPSAAAPTSVVLTEDGVRDLGDATVDGGELAVASYLTDHIVPLLIGNVVWTTVN